MVPDFYAKQDLTFDQVKVLTHAMLAVARVDGVHDNDMRMVREFYETCSRAGDPRLEDVAGGPFDPQTAKEHFSDPDLAKLYVKSLILLAYADGEYARLEDDLIREYAEAVGVNGGEVTKLHEATKEY
ncbi:MAG: TerB family tellurite resistance protein, partial [Myxococcota bacterium]